MIIFLWPCNGQFTEILVLFRDGSDNLVIQFKINNSERLNFCFDPWFLSETLRQEVKDL